MYLAVQYKASFSTPHSLRTSTVEVPSSDKATCKAAEQVQRQKNTSSCHTAPGPLRRLQTGQAGSLGAL
jgi:hypothetical protein